MQLQRQTALRGFAVFSRAEAFQTSTYRIKRVKAMYRREIILASYFDCDNPTEVALPPF
jgi:hypothetical protein